MSPLLYGMSGNFVAMEKLDRGMPRATPEWVEVNGK